MIQVFNPVNASVNATPPLEKFTIQAAVIGPLYLHPETKAAGVSPNRRARFSPSSSNVAIEEGVAAVRDFGATFVHIHPVAATTGEHRKTDHMYARIAARVRKGCEKLGLPKPLITADASLNSVDPLDYTDDKYPKPGKRLQAVLDTLPGDAPEDLRQYLRVRLAGLFNPSPPDMFTILATNEVAFAAKRNGKANGRTAKTFPLEYVQQFLQLAIPEMNRLGIAGLAEISVDPGGIASVRKGLAYLKDLDPDNNTYIPNSLSVSLLVGGDSFPIDPSDEQRLIVRDDNLEPVLIGGQPLMESPKERFMRLMDEVIALKDQYNLLGPINVGTIIGNDTNKASGAIDRHPMIVWEWLTEWVLDHPEQANKYGIVAKAGIEECASDIALTADGDFDRRQVDNHYLLQACVDYFDNAMGPDCQPVFKRVTDPDVVREWFGPSMRKGVAAPNFADQVDFSRGDHAAFLGGLG